MSHKRSDRLRCLFITMIHRNLRLGVVFSIGVGIAAGSVAMVVWAHNRERQAMEVATHLRTFARQHIRHERGAAMDPVQRANLLADLQQLQRYQSNDLRRGIQLYVEENGSALRKDEVSVWFMLYTLLRVIFNVPTDGEFERPPYGGGFWTGSDGELVRSWPLSEDSKGELQLTGTYIGYLGPEYDVLRDFDFLQMQFGRRRPNAR